MFEVIKRTFTAFSEDRCPTLAASLAYYTIFSLPPLLYILVMIVSLSVGWFSDTDESREEAYEVVQQQISAMIGNEEAQDEVGRIMKSSVATGGLGWRALLSFGGLIVAATGVVVALQDSMNRVWRVKPDPERSSWKAMIRKRFFSLAMILGFGLVIVASFVVNSIVSSLTGMVGERIGFQSQLATIANFLISFVLITLIIAALFKFMPDVQITWRDVWVGAIGTTILFTLGRIALGIYFSYSSPGAAVGAAAGSLVVLLVWVYFAALILLLGAEFTQAQVQQGGRVLEPEPGSVKFEEKTVPATSEHEQASERQR